MAPKACFERQGDVGLVVVGDPPLNLFGRQMVDDLSAALDRLEGEDVRALLVKADGEIFTGGADVNAFDGLREADAAAFARELLEITHRIEALPFPTLASVHGLCLTAGLELSLACDMVWAGESAQFGLVEAVVGVTPFMGGTQRMAERAGPARAREFVMSAGLYPASTLERWNVVNRVLPDAELGEKSLRFAERLAAGPTRAHDATKRIVRAFLDGGVRAADEQTPALAAALFESDDLQRAVKSFLEDGPGKATFQGR